MAKQLRVGETTIRRAYEAAKPSSDTAGPDPKSDGGCVKGSIKQEFI